MKIALSFFLSILVCFVTNAQETLFGFVQNELASQQTLEQQFLDGTDFSRFKTHLQTLSAVPHVVGSAANERVRAYIEKSMKDAGWEVKSHPYDVYLPKDPGESVVEIVTPRRIPLNQQEDVLEVNPYSSHPDLKKGWNAYSGSGDVTAEVVYANYGTKADFEKLDDLGVSVKGKIVLARYGGNFRGYKAKFAEQRGAAAVLIYTDPGDSGYAKGLVFPEGIYYSESSVQRGSLMTENFTGDPLTPFEPALPLDGDKKVTRLDPTATQLPTIPVTSIPYGSAKEIFAAMEGKPVPSGWQGGLPYTYRLEGGDKLTVRVMVEQKRDFVRINNVVGTLVGSEYPDEWIILGCHYDAWSFGATDPNSGTAMLLSLSESLGKLAQQGHKPKRSILIAHWDGEEHGVIGSTEWVEQFKDELSAKAVAYMNFDAGVSGKTVRGSSSPTLKHLMADAGREVTLPESEETIFENWAGTNKEPIMGNLGGGSDHIAFYMHLGIPSLSGGAGGPTLYHTNYDDLYFYEKFADPSFKMGGIVEQWVGIMALRLANATIIPYQVTRYATDLRSHFEAAEKQIKTYESSFKGFKAVAEALKTLESESDHFNRLILEKSAANGLSGKQVRTVNRSLLDWEKSFLLNEGMPFGPWYRSLYASTDPFSGYASWVLPAIQYEIELKSTGKLSQLDSTYANAIRQLTSSIEKAVKALTNE
nr:M28 family peptidase [Cytophagales bacterium]